MSLLVPIVLAAALQNPLASSPLARVDGLPDDLEANVIDFVGKADQPPDSILEARRRTRAAMRRLRTLLESEGYYDARMRVVGRLKAGETPAIGVEAGPPYTLVSVNVALDEDAPPALRRSILDAVRENEGRRARAQSVLDAESDAVARLVEAGYPDADAGDRHVVLDHDQRALEVVLRLSPGPFVRMRAIRQTGPARLRDPVLQTIGTFELGAPYQPAAVAELAERLRDTGAFRAVSVTLEETPNPTASEDAVMRDIVVALEDQPARSVAFGASYSTSEGAGGVAEWRNRNLFAGAETLSLSAEVAQLRRALEAALEAPHLGKLDRSGSLLAGVVQDDTDAFERLALEGRVGVEQPLRDHLSGGLALTFEVERVDDVDGRREGVTISAPLGVLYDRRDDILDPQKGVRLDLGLRPTAVFGPSAVRYLRNDVDLRGYLSPFPSLTFAARAAFGALLGAEADDVPADDRLFAGGGGSVRGFDFQALSPRGSDGQPFGGASALGLSAEARWRVRSPIGVVGFIDGGAAFAARRPSLSDLEWGGGLGLRYETPFGPLRLDVATPLTSRRAHDIGEVYISIGQAF